MAILAEIQFEADLRERVNDRFYKRPFKKYDLSGYPANVLKYIRANIENVSKEMVQGRGAKTELGKSFRTERRYRKDFKSGNMNKALQTYGYDPKQYKRYDDLPEDFLESYAEMEDQKQKHTQPGYLARNKLIKFLKNTQNTDVLVDAGIPIQGVQALQGCSETTLKNRIKKLEEAGKVIFEKGKPSHLYKEEDKLSIAKALADGLKRRK